jgi:hypothetical protein
MAKNNEQIESSFLLIADRQYNIVRGWKTELNSEFIKIPIDMGTETLLTSLSFKHVLRVEVLI